MKVYPARKSCSKLVEATTTPNKPMEDFLIDQIVRLLIKSVSGEELTEEERTHLIRLHEHLHLGSSFLKKLLDMDPEALLAYAEGWNNALGLAEDETTASDADVASDFASPPEHAPVFGITWSGVLRQFITISNS